MLSFDLQLILQKATEKAAKNNCEFVTLEHILEQFCLSKEGQSFFKWANIQMEPILIQAQDIIKKYCSKKSSHLPELTLALHRCINRAANQAQSAGKSSIQGCHVLITFFEEEDSFAAYILAHNKIDPLILMNYLTETSEDSSPVSKIEKYTLNLSEKLKAQPFHLVGRQKELQSLYQTLLRKSKNHSLILGDSGVGKTAFTMGFTQSLLEKKRAPQDLQKCTVYALNLGFLMAGTKYRGDLENRVNILFKELDDLEHSIVFIDDIHNLIGAGRLSSSPSDLSHLIKPFLENSRIRFIGTSTASDFRKHLENDPAFVRRFHKLELEEPHPEECLKIVEGHIKSFEDHHGVKYNKDSIDLAVRLSGQHLHSQKWPDKALDVLDEAGALSRLEKSSSSRKTKVSVSSKTIEKVIAQMAKIPEQTAEMDEIQKLRTLESALKSQIYGQDSAIQELVSAIQYSRSGLGPKQGPIGSFLFSGPTGVGKNRGQQNFGSPLKCQVFKV